MPIYKINGEDVEIPEPRLVDLSKPPDGVSLEDFIRQIVREEMSIALQIITRAIDGNNVYKNFPTQQFIEDELKKIQTSLELPNFYNNKGGM